MPTTTADLEWRDDRVPVSTRFDDPYYSLDNGLEETRHVFLAGNQLPDRFCDGLHIAELGFGTGLNFLTTLLEWRATQQQGKFHFTTFEAYPMAPTDMIRAQQEFPQLAAIADDLRDLWADLIAKGYAEIEQARISLITGDARDTVAEWDGLADCWFLDGFSPAKNPELWDADLMSAVGCKTKQGGTAATYTAAGFVRRNLEQAGFRVIRTSGFGSKRHMTTAVKE